LALGEPTASINFARQQGPDARVWKRCCRFGAIVP
jgi:hypothetical protein